MENKPSASPAYLKYFLFLAALFAIFTYFHDLIKESVTSDFIDTQHYYVNTNLLRQGYNPWEIAKDEYFSQAGTMIPQGSYITQAKVLHSPGFFLLFMPFSLLPFKIAAILWLIFCQLSFMAAAGLIFKMIGRVKIEELFTGLFLVFSFWPLREDFHIGQPNLLVLLNFALALLCLKGKRLFLAGIFLGLGIQVKESFLIVLLFCLRREYWKTLVSAIGILLAVKIVAIFAFGIDRELSYWSYQANFFLPQLAGKGYIDISSLSLVYFFYHLTQGLVNMRLLQSLISILVLLILIRVFKPRSDNKAGIGIDRLPLEFSFFVTLSFMLNIWAHETHLVVLCLPLLICWFYILRHPQKKDFILFIAAYLILGLKYAITSFPPLWKGPFSFMLSFKGLGYVLLFWLLARLLKRMPDNSRIIDAQ